MAVSQDSSRLNWLMAKWAEKRHGLARLLGRITDLGPAQGMSPRVFTKFLRMMDQVGAEQEKEIKIISEITAIEEKHRQQRLCNKLRQAGPAVPVAIKPGQKLEPEPPRRGFWWLLVWYMMMRGKINQKTHDLTGN